MLSCMLPFNCLSLIFKNMTSSWKSVKILLSICPLPSLFQCWIYRQSMSINKCHFFLYFFVSCKMLLKLVHDSQTTVRQSEQVLFPFYLRLKEFTASGMTVQDGRVRHGDYLLPHKCTKNTSACGTAPTEHLLNVGERPDFQKGMLIST